MTDENVTTEELSVFGKSCTCIRSILEIISFMNRPT